MELSTPKNITFWIAVALGVIGFVLFIFTDVPLKDWGSVAILVGLILLVLGNLLKGL